MNPLQRALESLRRRLESRIESIVLRAVVNAVNDGTGFQTVKVEALGDVFDKLEHLQQGGVSHASAPGAEGLLVCPLGRRNLGLVILASNRALRPKTLAPGETALWTALAGPLGGIRVHCKADGTVVAGSQDPITTQAVALADKTRAAISAMLQAGVAAGGAGAANFTAAKADWETPVTGGDVAATNLKGD